MFLCQEMASCRCHNSVLRGRPSASSHASSHEPFPGLACPLDAALCLLHPLSWFACSLLQGDLALLEKVLEGANAPVDEAAEVNINFLAHRQQGSLPAPRSTAHYRAAYPASSSAGAPRPSAALAMYYPPMLQKCSSAGSLSRYYSACSATRRCTLDLSAPLALSLLPPPVHP